MHEVVPRVVAIAVRMVMAKWMIFWMISFLFMVGLVFSWCFFFSPQRTRSSTEFFPEKSRVHRAAFSVDVPEILRFALDDKGGG